MSYLTQISNPTELVSLTEAKLHCRVDTAFVADDSWFTIAIQGAREMIESLQSRAWGLRSYRYVLDSFPRVIRLPIVPAVTITSIAYEDASGDSQTLTDYVFDPYSSPPRITPEIYQVFPATSGSASNVVVTFTAGSTTITARSKLAMLELILHMYEHRGDEDVKIPSTVQALAMPDYWGVY